MRISVACCTFNGEPYLREQLASIANQTRPPDEVIVSDDGSSDATVDILAEFAATVAFPVEVSVTPRRLRVARNYERAISRCTGDVIVLADQDDRWLPDRLARLEVTFAASERTLLAFSDAHLLRPDGSRRGDRLWSIVGFDERKQRRLRRDPFGQLMGRSIVSGCTLAFRATCRDLLLPFPDEETQSQLRVLHDRWISIVTAAVGEVAVIEEPLVEYRLHGKQQVGIPLLQIRKLVPSSLLRWRSAAVPTREHIARLDATIGLLRLIAERIDRKLEGEQRLTSRHQVDEAIAHLAARTAVHGSRPRRLAAVARESLTGRYHRYSLGTASAIADVVRVESKADELAVTKHPLVVYMHLPKTGGMTMRSIMQRQFGVRSVLTIRGFDNPDVEALGSLEADRRAGLRVLTGHVAYGIDAFVDRPAMYVTMLRDPVERTVSAFWQAQRTPGTRHPAPESLDEFLDVRQGEHNLQARLLAGERGVPAPVGDDTVLAKAKQRLESFAAVGITERFDESLLVFERKLGWRHLAYARRNVSGDDQRRETLLPGRALERVSELNAIDVELYRWALELFEHELAALGRFVPARVALRRVLNVPRQLQHVYAERSSTSAKTISTGSRDRAS